MTYKPRNANIRRPGRYSWSQGYDKLVEKRSQILPAAIGFRWEEPCECEPY